MSVPKQIDPELTYTQELARVLQAQIRAASIAQERVCGKGQSLAFDRALERGQEALVGMLRKACDELGPIEDSEEGRRFLESLEHGEIAAPSVVSFTAEDAESAEKIIRNSSSSVISGARGAGAPGGKMQGAAPTSKRRESGRPPSRKAMAGDGCDSNGAKRELSAEEKSKQVMAQWR